MTTLSQLKAKGEGLAAHCNRPGLVCGHHKTLDLDMLIQRFGPDYSVINETRIAGALVCERCGYRGGRIMLIANTKPNGYALAKGI